MTRSTGIATVPRLFVAPPLAEGADLPASSDQAYYLGSMPRRSAEDSVRVFDGADKEWLARVPPVRHPGTRHRYPIRTGTRRGRVGGRSRERVRPGRAGHAVPLTFCRPDFPRPVMLRAETAATACLALLPAMGCAEYVGAT